MITRRDTLLGGVALVLAARPGRAETAVALDGRIEQGALVIGRAGSGAAARLGGRTLRVSPDGVFAFGFGRDDTAAVELSVRLGDGRSETRMLTPVQREYRIQRIDGLPGEYVAPPDDVLARIRRDNAAVGAARARDTARSDFAGGFDWPVTGPITGVYGSQRILNGEPRRPHFGIDIAAGEGAPIVAPQSGIVALAEDLYFSGNTIVLDHGHGVSTTYLHLSRMDVKPGDTVAKGAMLGAIGATGRATGPHLCWRLNWFQERLDPGSVVGPMPG